MTSPMQQECAAAQRHRPRWAILVAVTVVMAIQVALSLWGIVAGAVAPLGWVMVVDVAVGILSCCLVLVLYRHPVGTAVIAAVLVVGSTTAIPVSTVATIQVARTRSTRTAVIVAGLGVAGHALRALWRSTGGVGMGWWILLVVAIQTVFYLWGVRSRMRDELVASLRARAEAAEAEQRRRVAQARLAERSRIAREMHDVLAHRLSMIATYAGALEFRPDADEAQRERAARVIRESSHQALGDLREVIGVLRGDADGDASRPQPGAADLADLVQESVDAGIPVVLRAPAQVNVPHQVGRTIYRVVQEGLTNVRKHAPGQPAIVGLERTDTGWSLEISNPIGTAPVGRAIPGSGVGLVGLEERVNLTGGTLHHAVSGKRFVLSATLPWGDGPSGAGADR